MCKIVNGNPLFLYVIIIIEGVVKVSVLNLPIYLSNINNKTKISQTATIDTLAQLLSLYKDN